MNCQNSYAAKILKDQKIKVFANGKEILNQEYLDSFSPLKTVINKSTDFQRTILNDSGIKKIYDYQELLNLGFKLIKYKPKNNYFKGQKIAFMIVATNYQENDWQKVNTMPPEHHVQYDMLNKCLRGVGSNFCVTGITEWIPMQKDFCRDYEDYDGIDFKNTIQAAKRTFLKNSGLQRNDEFFEIKELLIGISEEGYWVTMPPPRKSNPYFILIFGGRGCGKTLLFNNLEDGFFWKFGLFCANINDIKPECFTRCLPWDENFLYKELRRMGEDTIPKPAVYFYPTSNKSYDKKFLNEIGFEVSLPLRELMKDENLITYNDSWEFKKDTSLIEYRNLIFRHGKLREDGLASIRTIEEAFHLIDSEVKEKGMNGKLKRVISDIFNTNLIDASSGVSSKWVYQKNNSQEVDYAWNVAMKCGLFPYLVTSGVRNQLWFALYLRFVIESIMNFASKNPIPTQIGIDEMEGIIEDDSVREIINTAIRECRSSNVGVSIVAHNFTKLPTTIYTHSSGEDGYRFIFNTTDEKLISNLKKQNKNYKSLIENIPHLKKRECLAFGNFKLYDNNGNSFYNNGQPIKIARIKPPNSRHLA